MATAHHHTQANKSISVSQYLRQQNFLFLLFSIAGMSFFFFLGFPFANHQESYMWLPQLERINFLECFTNQIYPVANHRPLGIATAWLTYHVSGDIYLQQFVNWLFAISSFIVLYFYCNNRVLFSLTAFVAGAGFFSGYIYLFHLQGVFYGPLQLYIAALLVLGGRSSSISKRELIVLFAIAIVVAFFHPFVLFVFIAFLIGIYLELLLNKKHDLQRITILLAVGTAITWWLLVPALPSESLQYAFIGGIVSYKLIEINALIGLLSLLLGGYVIWDKPFAGRFRYILFIVLIPCSILFFFAKIPLLLIWIAACCLKMLLMRKWAMVSLIGATALLPFATATGSPTYAVFVIMACIYCTCFNATWIIKKRFVQVFAYFMLVLLAVLFLLSATGYHVPVINKFLSPILAEKEKTFQLEKIIKTHISTYSSQGFSLQLVDSANYPVHSKNNIERLHRPPTNQFFLDQYLKQTNVDSSRKKLLVTFGDQKVEGAKMILEEKGIWNGSAFVFELVRSQ